MKKSIAVIILIFIVGCKSSESLSFYHKNSLKIFNDEIKIKLIPIKKKDSAFVKIKYHTSKIGKGKTLHSNIILENRQIKFKKYIPVENYNKMVENFNKIDSEKLKYPQYGIDENGNKYIDFGPMDAGYNKLTFTLNGKKTEFISNGISEPNYLEIVENILKIADLKVNSAN